VIRRALRVSIDGLNPFQVVQATWNLLERSAAAALAEAKARGWGVIVKEALANGRLTGRATVDAASVHTRTLAREAERLTVSIDALALACALAQPWADVVLSGATTVTQLESNLAASSIEVPDDTVNALRAMAMGSADYWRERSALPWN